MAEPAPYAALSGQLCRAAGRLRLIAEDELNGPLYGWDGATVFALANGQRWQQSKFRLRRLRLQHPWVRVWRCGLLYWLEVEGAGELLPVRRIS